MRFLPVVIRSASQLNPSGSRARDDRGDLIFVIWISTFQSSLRIQLKSITDYGKVNNNKSVKHLNSTPASYCFAFSLFQKAKNQITTILPPRIIQSPPPRIMIRYLTRKVLTNCSTRLLAIALHFPFSKNPKN